MGKYDPERTFEFWSGPDKMTAALHRYTGGGREGEPYISIHGKGPRGGYAPGPYIPQSAFAELQAMIEASKVVEP